MTDNDIVKIKSIKEDFDKNGFVVINGFLNENELIELKQASSIAISLTRNLKWPYKRTVGNSFPPFNNDNDDSWGVQHLLHPDLNLDVFKDFYSSHSKLLHAVTSLLECDLTQLQLELFNLLILPTKSSFNLSWHRDHIRHNATRNEEYHQLQIPHFGVQFNLPLVYDDYLYVIPKSHKEVRSKEVYELSCDKDKPCDNPFLMPGAIQVKLDAGSILFYDSNILHVATYPIDSNNDPSNPARATLHGSYGDVRGGCQRAVGVFQHDLHYIKDLKFNEDDIGRTLWLNLLKMEDEAKQKGLLNKYSL